MSHIRVTQKNNRSITLEESHGKDSKRKEIFKCFDLTYQNDNKKTLENSYKAKEEES